MPVESPRAAIQRLCLPTETGSFLAGAGTLTRSDRRRLARLDSRHSDETGKSERALAKPDGRRREFGREAVAAEIAKISCTRRRACAVSRGLGHQGSVTRRLMILSPDQRSFGLLNDLAFNLEEKLDNLLPLFFTHLSELHA